MTPHTSMDIPEHENALLPGTRLGEFEVLSVIGVGGFGIVYRALDHDLEREVAIKEYMPGQLAGRDATGAVTVHARTHAETFGIGLRSFVNEARLLARFDHPALLKVYRYWEANGTAYMAMPFYDGHTLTQILRDMPAPPAQEWLMGVIEPLLGALELLHSQQIYHRDISPDNILLLENGRPILLDFGAARHVISDRTQALTAILKPNYAPIEQYAEIPGLKQGPWTDLYALGAVIYAALTGHPPSPAATRAVLDDMTGLDQIGVQLRQNHQLSYTPAFLTAWQSCLVVKPGGRPQSVAELRRALHNQAHSKVADSSFSPRPPAVSSAAAPPITSLPPRAEDRAIASAPASIGDPEKTVIRRVNPHQPAILPTPPIKPPPAPPLPPPQPPPLHPSSPSRRGAAVFIGLGGLGLVLAGLGFYRFFSSPVPPSIPPAAQAPAAQAPAAQTPTAQASAPTYPRAPEQPAAESALAIEVPASTTPNKPVLAVPKPAMPTGGAAQALTTHPLPPSQPSLQPKRAPTNLPPVNVPSPLPTPDPTTATEICRGERGYLNQGICMARECKNPKFANQPDCLRIKNKEDEHY